MSSFQGHDSFEAAVAEASANFFSLDIDHVWVRHKEVGGHLGPAVFEQAKWSGMGNCPSCSFPAGNGHHEKCRIEVSTI